MQDLAAQHFADRKRAVIHETWGHLFPKNNGTGYDGTIVIGCPVYGYDTVILKELIDIDSSPWWYATVHDWADNMMDEYGLEAGDVCSFTVNAKVIEFLEDEEYTMESIDTEIDYQIEEGNLTTEEEIEAFRKQALDEALTSRIDISVKNMVKLVSAK